MSAPVAAMGCGIRKLSTSTPWRGPSASLTITAAADGSAPYRSVATYQVGSNIVIGAFGDYDFADIKGDMSVLAAGWIGEEKLKNSWAAGGRIGWIPWSVAATLGLRLGRLYSGAI